MILPPDPDEGALWAFDLGPDAPHPTLTTLVPHSAAHHILGGTPNEAVEWILDLLSQAIGQPCPAPLASAVTSWASDPYSRGSFSYPSWRHAVRRRPARTTRPWPRALRRRAHPERAARLCRWRDGQWHPGGPAPAARAMRRDWPGSPGSGEAPATSADQDRAGARDPASPSSGGHARRGRSAGPDSSGAERRLRNCGCSPRGPGRGATGRQFGHLLDDSGRPRVPDLCRRNGQPGSQQHPGVAAGPRQGQRLRDRPARRPGDRGAEQPQLPAAGRVEVHPRAQRRRAEGRPPVDRHGRRSADCGHVDGGAAGLGRQRHR